MNPSTAGLFSQLLSPIERNHIARLVGDTGHERPGRGLACWDHFVAMLFCRLAQARGLLEIDAGVSRCEGTLKHFGMAGAAGRPTPSYANSKRPAELFERLSHQLPSTATQTASIQPHKRRSTAVLDCNEIREDFKPLVAHEAPAGLNHWVMVLLGRTALRDFPEVTVPAGQFFVMGDSRDNSTDSRYFGLIERKQIVGRAEGIVVSSNLKHDFLPRLARFFSKLDG